MPPPPLPPLPGPPIPPIIDPARRIDQTRKPNSSRVGRKETTFDISIWDLYVTGTDLEGSRPSSCWALSRLRSNVSTLPMENQRISLAMAVVK